MKLLLENWRKFINEVSLGSDLAKSIEYTAFFLDPSHEGTIKLKEMWSYNPYKTKNVKIQ